MKHELSSKLKTAYPDLFEYNPLLECGDGWFNIIDTLCLEISSHLKSLERSSSHEIVNESDEQSPVLRRVRFTQIKEKFGTLRVYCDTVDDYVFGLVNMADAISARICESCGKPGKLRDTDWIRCMCDEHFMAQSLGAPDSFMSNVDEHSY